jgi:hypothetical protein
MKTLRSQGLIHTFLTFVWNECVWSVSHPDHFVTPTKEDSRLGWPRANLDMVAKSKILVLTYWKKYSKLTVIWYPSILNSYANGKYFKETISISYFKNEVAMCICSFIFHVRVPPALTSTAAHHCPSCTTTAEASWVCDLVTIYTKSSTHQPIMFPRTTPMQKMKC